MTVWRRFPGSHEFKVIAHHAGIYTLGPGILFAREDRSPLDLAARALTNSRNYQDKVKGTLPGAALDPSIYKTSIIQQRDNVDDKEQIL